MAKHGIVALTKAFKTSEPNVSENENIKCYALAPWYTDTNLVRSAVTLSQESQAKWINRGTTIASLQDLTKATKMRVLNVNEVGQGLIKSLEYDKVRKVA